MKMPSTEELKNGDYCTICFYSLAESYGRPIACGNCGGDAVLEQDEIDNELVHESGQFGAGA